MKYDKQFKKKLRKYISEKRKKKIPVKTLKAAFRKRGYKEKDTNAIFREFYTRKILVFCFSFVVAFALFGFMTFNIETVKVTQAVAVEERHEEALNLFSNDTILHEWFPEAVGPYFSFDVSGKVSRGDFAKILLQVKDKEYVLFEANSSISSNLLAVDNPKRNESKEIQLELEYVNIAEAGTDEKIGLSVKDTKTKSNLSSEHMCTVWGVGSEAVCHGSERCCSFADFPVRSEKWNDDFYVTYGAYSSDLQNTVSAQVIYADYNISVENPYSETYFSQQLLIPISFYEDTVQFQYECVETCSLPELNESQLNIVIKTNGSVSLDSISYTTETEIETNGQPVLSSEFLNKTIEYDGSFSINLSSHFVDPNNDTLSFENYNTTNLIVEITNETATIKPVEDYAGTEYMFFVASDGALSATSNIFSVKIKKKPEEKQIRPLSPGFKSLRAMIG